jgi:ADP-heptose:LPS heptosyltransferase
VIKPGALGDTLLLAPALRALREALPALGINVVGSLPAVGLLKLFGVADDVRAIDRFNLYAPAESEYELLCGTQVLAFMPLEARVCTDLHNIAGLVTIRTHPSGAMRSGQHMAVYLYQCLRASFPEMRGLSKAPFPCEGVQSPTENAPYTILAPGAGSAAKRAPMAVFEGAAEEVSRRGGHPVFVAGEVEIEHGLIQRYPKQYPLYRNPSLDELALLLQRAGAVFANDSGPAHLAAMLGTATTVFFGPTDPAVWRPWGPKVSIQRF